jgi:hypothetical protein
VSKPLDLRITDALVLLNAQYGGGGSIVHTWRYTGTNRGRCERRTPVPCHYGVADFPFTLEVHGCCLYVKAFNRMVEVEAAQ